MKTLCVFGILILTVAAKAKQLEKEDCPICFETVDAFRKTYDSNLSYQQISEKFREFCEKTKDEQQKTFCYYIGGLKDSATGILNEMSKPLSNHFPTYRICEKLKEKDNDICQLRKKQEIKWETKNDLKKMKVRDLKKILNTWGESCSGCTEKQDYVDRIMELKPIHKKEEL